MAELSGLEIESLIKACCEYGVSSLKYKQLMLTFNRWPTVASKQALQSSAEGGEPEVPAVDEGPSLDDLFIEDPAAYEDALLRANDR